MNSVKINSKATERFYSLLPAIYRQRDAAQGEPLRALLAVMETELRAIETDIEGLYENWFIETCEEWVVPYIADLLGIRSLSDQESTRLSHRAYVANTIAYRRRKGVPAILESITLDVTGWRSSVVEYFERVSITQQVNHVRPGKGSTFDIRNQSALDRLRSPFDPFAYSVDVRRIASQYPIRGQSNPLNLGLFVWRLQSYPIRNSRAAQVQAGCYTVHPFGQDMPLFNRPQTKTDLTQRTEMIHLPCPLGVEALADDLQDYKTRYLETEANLRPPNSKFYGSDRSFSLIRNGQPVAPINIVSCHLDSWQFPALEPEQIAIDVERGRFFVRLPDDNHPPPTLEISYCYGFSADLGGGPYDRHQTLANRDTPGTQFQTIAGGNGLLDALAGWQNSDYSEGIIQITDNDIYGSSESAIPLTLPESSRLTLEAADGTRPAIQSPDFVIEAMGTGASLTLNGLLFKGSLTLRGTVNLTLIHCTVLGGIKTDSNTNSNVELQATIAHSIVGSLHVPAEGSSLIIQDSIIDSRPDAASIADKSAVFAIAASDAGEPGAQVTIERTTIFGRVNVSELSLASNAIFTAPIAVERQHTGSIRFSSVSPDSVTPPRYRCQPDLKLSDLKLLKLTPEEEKKASDRALLLLTPRFTSVTYGEPGYAQLDNQCAPEISAGADDGSEMGVFHLLHQPQRKAYLQLNLEEYVPSGLEIGIFYIT